MGANDCEQHVGCVLDREKPQLMIFHCGSHILKCHLCQRTCTEIKDQSEHELQVDQDNEQNAKAPENGTKRLFARPPRPREKSCSYCSGQNQPAQ